MSTTTETNRTTPQTPTPAHAQMLGTAPPIPPRVLALARYASRNHHRLPDAFRTAWAAMPAILDAISDGEDDSSARVSCDSVIEQLFEADVERSRSSDHPYGRELAEAVDRLNAVDEDVMFRIVHPNRDAGFWVGLAFALYLLEGEAQNAGGAQ